MNARDSALVFLDKKSLPNWKPHLIRVQKPRVSGDPRDLALAEQIVTGVVKNLLLLQHHVEHYSGKSLIQIDPLVVKILAIAMYQLKFLTRVPASAAVDQAVEQARRFGRQRSAGFVNAVLRNVERLAAPPIPNLSTDADALMAEWQHLHQKQQETNLPALPQVEFAPHHQPGLLVVTGARSAILTRWSQMGLAQVQDPTAASVSEHLQLLPGQTVLDRCCGLGTKTIQILERIGTSGKIIAVDPAAGRCQTLRQLLHDRAIQNVQVIQSGKLAPVATLLPDSFDRILIDVPCSNSGVLPRRPEARYARNLNSLKRLQSDILNDTIAWLANGGILVYSTCSIWPDENERPINDLLQRHPNLTLVTQQTTLPSFDSTQPTEYHDGGYFAVVRKTPITE